MHQNILSIQNLSIAFGETQAVKGLSFHLHEGEILGIVGESGSGKSVTSLSLLGLLDKTANIALDSGEFKAGGKSYDLKQISAKDFQQLRGTQIGMIFQEPMTALNPSYTCGNQIIEGIKTHQKRSKKDAKKMALDWLEKVGLKDVERVFRSYPHQISGGQKQRVMIAMVMALSPKLLIADEPTTALDAQIRRSILDLISTLSKEQGNSVLFISHDLDAIKYISDRILVMRNGVLVETLSSSRLNANAQSDYTKGLIACKPPIYKQLKRLPTLNNLTPSESIVPKKQENEVILEVNDLTVEFADKGSLFGKDRKVKRAVDNVHFTLQKGQTLGIIGESGSGKSTIGNAIMRFVKPAAGTIHFNGKEIFRLKGDELKHYRQQVQVIYQDPYSSLNPRQQIGEAIREPMVIHGIGSKTAQKKEIENLLEMVELPKEVYHRYPHEFSGGQRQRICVARALALKPQLVICDEAVSALDLSVQATTLNLLKDLQEKLGISYLFITHDISVARFIGHNILVLRNGQIQEYGPVAQVIDTPESDYTKMLIEEVQFL